MERFFAQCSFGRRLASRHPKKRIKECRDFVETEQRSRSKTKYRNFSDGTVAVQNLFFWIRQP